MNSELNKLTNGETINLTELIDNMEYQLTAQAMSVAKGNITQAARLLGLSRTTLSMRLKKGRKLESLNVKETH